MHPNETVILKVKKWINYAKEELRFANFAAYNRLNMTNKKQDTD